MKMVKGLTKANVGKYGIEVREDLDFSDDGNRFKGFSYKGIPMTQCRCYGECYLAIRVDYIHSRCEFTYDEWRATEEYKLADEFNGVSEFDMDKLIQNLEAIRKKIDELNEEKRNEVIDMTPVANRLCEEIAFATDVINRFKQNYRWYDAKEYELRNMADYTRGADRTLKSAKDLLGSLDGLTRQERKEYTERLERYGYVKVQYDGFYLREMREVLEKQEERGA